MTEQRARVLLLTAAAVVTAACGKARPLDIPERCPSWKDDVASLVGARCASCHTGAAPAGGYDVSSYAAAIEGGAVDRLPVALADDLHAGVVDTLPLLSRWTGECELAYVPSTMHGRGILDPGNATDFHGVLIARAGWRMEQCARCHGADLTGGAAQASCVSCHTEDRGPRACTTCHDQPPATGSHLSHVTSDVACSECHTVPVAYDDPGHPAAPGDRVALGPRAGDQARYDLATKTCSGVYCHGGTLADTAAQDPTPTWGQGPAAAACGACHGRPPADHTSSGACSSCHPRVVAPDGTIAQAALHIDGAVDLGFDGTGGCASCHGQPPPSGSHLAHVAKNVACNECHAVPTTYDDAGHPAARADLVKFGPTANFGGRARYDLATQTCSGVYCHGGTLDDSAAQNPGPTWGAGPEAAACGACHGRPPADHGSTDACSTCHPRVVATDGTIAQAALHIDRAVDLGTDGLGSCTSCHDNPSAPLDGAHAAHLASPYVLRGPLVCADCHRVPATVDAPGHIDSSLPAEVPFGTLALADSASPAWNAAVGTCSGTYCHGGGAGLSSDRTLGLVRTPSWAGTSAQVACGRACHGTPPRDGSHSSESSSCASCHRQTVDSARNIIIINGTSKHMNGVIDATSGDGG